MLTVTTAVSIALLLAPAPAFAWGYEGHEIIATIARADLTPAVRAKVDAILATDPDTLTKPDMVSRATWADAWRSAGHRETAQWHFVDTELDGPDLKAACFGFPTASDPASAGPATDCIVDKIREFTAELASVRFARDADVTRVVMTSSVAAIAYGHPPSRTVFSEADWTNLPTMLSKPIHGSRQSPNAPRATG